MILVKKSRTILSFRLKLGLCLYLGNKFRFRLVFGADNCTP